jgi:nicotinamide mononucleotide adenylyltransferase
VHCEDAYQAVNRARDDRAPLSFLDTSTRFLSRTLKQSNNFTIDHSYCDFRWFRPNRQLQLLVATGRFQQIHYGHLLYLREALFKAIETAHRFRIISGPSDNEYRNSGDAFTPFRERQFLLSLLLSIPRGCIVEGIGRPSSEIKSEQDLLLKPDRVRKHHEQTNDWVRNFFHPIDITAADGLASQATLFVTAKEEDMIYHEDHPLGPIHPIHLVSNYWKSTERIEVYNPQPVSNTSGEIIRSSTLDFDDPSIHEIAPAAACAAAKLIKKKIFGREFQRFVSRIHKRFGFGMYVPGQLD